MVVFYFQRDREKAKAFTILKPTLWSNVSKVGPIIELKKLTVHGSLVEPTIELMTS